VLRGFAEEGIRDVILDLRTNAGGSLSSAVKLSSALLSASFEGATLCEVRRNPKNRVGKEIELFALTAMECHLDIDHLTVITSNHTASASELVIMGLRGLDIPVTLVGSATQGKNCGMDVTRRTIGTTYFEYAPITFMCFNAKGVGDWGEGIAVDVDVKAEEEHYPMPYVPWGSKYVKYDAALRLALEHLGILFDNATRGEAVVRDVYPSQVEIALPMEGIRLYE
jgi:C-terminal processing protease CtpA/Prc